MQINSESIKAMTTGFQSKFLKGLMNLTVGSKEIAIVTQSKTLRETYNSLLTMPMLRPWKGQRASHDLKLGEITVENGKFQEKIVIPRDEVEDDQYQNYGMTMEALGIACAQMPDQQIFNLLKNGNSKLCFDKQYFFDNDHPWYDANGRLISISNFQDGPATNPLWIVADLSQETRRPIIYQQRVPPEFIARTRPDDHHVFDFDEYVYGVRVRAGFSFGLWHYCYASRQTLNMANLRLAFAALEAMRSSNGSPLGVKPTHLVVPTSLREDAMRLVQVPFIDATTTNPWAKSLIPIIDPYMN
ncbi:MAG: Mu-like prophage major head subunit gpT family protein [Candidatus Symbiobacter sp.]|nr:Mu-like prophage major head subunit gpT family protein [Candidatus Symbiobacter sp.]